MSDNQQLTIPKDELPVLMRSGLVHWVKTDTHTKLRAVLTNQNGHSFVNLSELNITINTADISAVCTVDEYQDLMKIKEGMRKCAYRKWHGKKEECQCEKDALDRARTARAQAERDADNKPLTPEERERNQENFRTMNEMAAINGLPGSIFRSGFAIGNRSGRELRKSTIAAWEQKNGRKANLDGLAIEGMKKAGTLQKTT